MVAIEEVLWNIFTHYTLTGNPRDPSRLHSMALLKLCKDVMALDPMMSESPISPQDLHLIYTSVLKNPRKGRNTVFDKADKLDFDEFLSCIVKVAQKCYPSSVTQEAAMQRFLMENMLPLALRREPVSILSLLKIPAVDHLLKQFEPALADMFRFFAITADQNTKEKNMVKATANIVKTFDDQKNIIQEAKMRCAVQSAVAHQIGYTDFVRFAHDVGLVSSLSLTMLDLGDIYLTVISFGSFSASLRRIDFKEFCEALLRIAIVSFKDRGAAVSLEDKVRGLFLYMFRYLQELLQQHRLQYGTIAGGGFNTYRESLLRAVEPLCSKFLAMWTQDKYRNYPEDLTQVVHTHRHSSNKSSTFQKKMETEQQENKSSARGKLGNSTTPATRRSLHNGKQGNMAGTSSPPPMATTPTSLLDKLKKSNVTGATTRNSAATTPTASPTKTVPPPAQLSANSTTTSSPYDGKEEQRLYNLLHDDLADSDSFIVRSSDHGRFRIKVGNSDRFGDGGRICAEDLRKLFIFKPDVAAILFDSLVEEGIMEYEYPSTMTKDEINLPEEKDLNTAVEDMHINVDDVNDASCGQGEEGNHAVEGDLDDIAASTTNVNIDYIDSSKNIGFEGDETVISANLDPSAVPSTKANELVSNAADVVL